MLNKIKNNYILIAILIFAAILRIYHIDFQSIWIDEIHTMIESDPKLSYSEFYEIMAFREQMPHLYFHITRIVAYVFGHSSFAMRMISAIIGVASVYAIYLLGRTMLSKKTGIIAALLLCVNYFHIWYSQEARPYVLLSLFTILSFYRLILFIRDNNLKNATYFGIFAALMINTHFFGLFVLVAQVLILVLVLLEKPKSEKIPFIKKTIITGFLILLLWLPSIKIFFIVTKIKSFWIQPPGLDVYTQLFKDLFGGAESLLYIVFVLSLFYFNTTFNKKSKKHIEDNKSLLSFCVLTIWIFITLFIPFLRSYLDIPMIISRYFISVLPAIILILAISITNIKQVIIQRIILLIFVTISLTDLLAVKNYYNTPSKTQYEELTKKIIEKNTSNAIVVSTWAWHLNYFFKNDSINTNTREQKLQDFVDNMQTQKTREVPFWFIGAHFQNYELTEKSENYLKENFNLVEDFSYFDCWTKYYVPKSDKNSDKNSIRLDMFKTATFDGIGNMILFENTEKKSTFITLEKGEYDLVVKGVSLPKNPIDNENAHLVFKIDDTEIANVYLSNLENNLEEKFSFSNDLDRKVRFKIIYDNDIVKNSQDRNAILNYIKLEKK
ncbi:glycosyltransferase family 39 protein [uncultured Flavobacterium sp.]|uniref:glycosyltransferase family 39 protein n=1 Tax=uncultured Flavobacterium sp. TaxID=165435 RepID=UPI0030C82443